MICDGISSKVESKLQSLKIKKIIKKTKFPSRFIHKCIIQLADLLKYIIKILHIPSGHSDSYLALAREHIYIVWKDKVKRNISSTFELLGVKSTYKYHTTNCYIAQLDKQALIDISQGRLSNLKRYGFGKRSKGLMLPRFHKLHIAIAKDACINTRYGAFCAQGIPLDGAFFVRAGIFVNGVPEKSLPANLDSYTKINVAFFVNELQLSHFGHSITDGLSSVFLLLLLADMGITPKVPIIINKQISAQKSDLLKLFDLNDVNVLIPGVNCGNLLVTNLVYGVPTMVNSGRIKGAGFVASSHSILVKKYLKRLMAYKDKINSSGVISSSKIYLSRSRLQKSVRQFTDEAELEKELHRLGWIIYHPQEHSLNDQLNLLNSSTRICSAQGSALHLLFGVDPKPNLRVTILAPTNCNFNYTNQMRAQGINYKIISCLDVVECAEEKLPWLKDLRLMSNWSALDLAMQIDKF